MQFKTILTDLLGKSGVETLEKAIFRRGTQNVADPLELYLPLLVVPRTILSWLAQNIKPMKVGSHTEFQFPGKEDITIYVEKQNTDTYRGDIIQGGKVVHSFDKQTLPSIGGHLMTVGEFYDFDEKKHDPGQLAIGTDIEKEHKKTVQQIVSDVKAGKVKPFEEYFQNIAEDHLDEYKDYYDRLVVMEQEAEAAESGGVVETLMDLGGVFDEMQGQPFCPKQDAEKYKWFITHENTKELVGVIGKLIDHLVSRNDTKTKIDDFLDKEELRGDPQKVTATTLPTTEKECKAVAQENKPPKSEGVVHDPEVGNVHEKAEMPSGAAAARQPLQPKSPVQASREPAVAASRQALVAEKQAEASQRGQVSSSLKPKMPKKIGAPAKPISASPKPPGVSMKAEFEGRTSPTGYFKKKLSACNIYKKKEKIILTEADIFAPCVHCGVPEFVKSEGKPHFKPCDCFKAETKDRHGKDRIFVSIEKNEKGYYELEFHKDLHPEQIRAFLLTVKASILNNRRNLGN